MPRHVRSSVSIVCAAMLVSECMPCVCLHSPERSWNREGERDRVILHIRVLVWCLIDLCPLLWMHRGMCVRVCMLAGGCMPWSRNMDCLGKKTDSVPWWVEDLLGPISWSGRSQFKTFHAPSLDCEEEGGRHLAVAQPEQTRRSKGVAACTSPPCRTRCRRILARASAGCHKGPTRT